MSGASDRHSQAAEPELVRDENQKAELEAYNQLRQFDEVAEQIDYWLDPERPFRLRPSAILGLNRVALEGLSSFAGSYRPAGIEIGGSKHQPPPAFDAPSLLEDLRLRQRRLEFGKPRTFGCLHSLEIELDSSFR